MNAKIIFRLPYRVERERDVWVASCDILDVVSQGDDREDAGRMLTEALQLFFEGCLESGTLDDVLRTSGFEFEAASADDALATDDGEEYLDVPLSLLVAGHGAGQHAS